MTTPQPPQPAKLIGDARLFNFASIQPFGFVQEEKRFTSPNSGITYNFPRLYNAASKDILLPVFSNGAAGAIELQFIPASDIPKMLSADPSMGVFPGSLAGFAEFVKEGYTIFGPKWCIDGIAELETRYSNPQTPTAATLILREQYPGNGEGVIHRDRSFMEGLFQPAQIPGRLDMRLETPGQPTQNIPGTSILADPGAKVFIGEKMINPKAGVTVKLIGRLTCTELLEKLIVVALPPQQQQAVVVPGGFMPPPGGFSGIAGQTVQQAPAGFAPIPGQAQQAGAPSSIIARTAARTITLPPDIVSAVDSYLDRRDEPRSKLEKLVSIIQETMKNNMERITGGHYFKVSSTRANQNIGSDSRGGTYGKISGMVYDLRLSMTKTDLAALMGKELPNITARGEYQVYADSIFTYIAERVARQMGSALVGVSETPGPVPSSILASIPAGPSPISRPKIVSRSPFADVVPLAGVSDVTVPISNGTRCVAGLMTKKRD